MKTTRSNSFRLHRISKTNSLKKGHDSTFINADEVPFKLEAIHSINKGVKYNDLSFITGRDHLHKLRKQPTSQTDIAFDSAHVNMNDMRRKYDDVKKKSLYLEESITRLREQKDKYELKQNDFNGGKNKGKDKVQTMQKDLEGKKVHLESTETERKVLLSIINRHKTDKVFYDHRKFSLQQEFSHLKKQLKIFLKQGTQIGQNKDRTTKVYEKFLNQLESEKKQRDNHLYNVQDLLFNKAQVLQANQTRGLQIQEIAERAMLDKNLNEKQWEKIFLTHTFLNKMLRHKIERQMQKFKVVEFAFKEIKTSTGVNDAQLLVSKYLNKEEVYGELLSKISQNEKRIQQFKSDTDKLLAEEKILQTEKEILQNSKIAHSDLHDVIKELELYQDKQQSCELYQSKLINWLQRQLKKFELFDKKSEIPKGKRNLAALFQLYSDKLSESLSKVSEVQVQPQPSLGSNLESDRLVRVVPKKSRKNSKGEDIFDVDEQETNASNLAEQIDIVAIQREQVLRTNEKFMKQMRKKREEMKKVLIEAMQRAQKQKEKPKVEIKKDE